MQQIRAKLGGEHRILMDIARSERSSHTLSR
jgi:hypothetical protein